MTAIPARQPRSWAVRRAGMCTDGADGSSHRWRGPTPRSTGPGSSCQISQAYPEATFRCVGTRSGGGVGRTGKQGTPLSNERRASWQKGQEPRLSPIPHYSSSSVSVYPGAPEAKSKKRRRCCVGRRAEGVEAPSLPKPESPGDHSIWGCPGGKEGERGPSCLPGARGKLRCLGASLAQQVARLSWVFGRPGNSSKR